jgi:hypothetical protein
LRINGLPFSFRAATVTSDYDLAVSALDPAERQRLGENYLALTRDRRSLPRPSFSDKQPYNFWHIALIELILPNARVVDVRRHPIACCFSNFTQNYVTAAASFSHRSSDLGYYYRD